MDATDLILGHIDSTLDNKAAADLLTLVPLRDLCSTLATLLQSGDETAIGDAMLVIRDAALMTSGPRRGAFRVGLRRYGIIERLEACLVVDSHSTRGGAVYTLGKLCSAASIPALHQAFMIYRETDPLLVPSVIFELRWLGEDEWALWDSAIESRVYTTRWSIIDGLAGNLNVREPVGRAKQHERLARLMQDEHILVRREAEYASAALTSAPQLDTGSREESAEVAPPLLFTECARRFHNYLVQEQRPTYTVRELEDFIADLVAAPPETA